VRNQYFGLIPFSKAKQLQEIAWLKCKQGEGDTVLGFELEPVVTLGARASENDVLWQEDLWKNKGFSVEKVERGGQATIHNPGQLVIFPVLDIRTLGVKKFVRLLASATQVFLHEHGCEAEWNECQPGLYSKIGKVASIGLRVKSGIVNHGLAINIHNDLQPFDGIRVCGSRETKLDHLRTERGLDELFSSWNQTFTAQLTRPENSHNLESDLSCVRL
jgi:lipoate-protein ligase B